MDYLFLNFPGRPTWSKSPSVGPAASYAWDTVNSPQRAFKSHGIHGDLRGQLLQMRNIP